MMDGCKISHLEAHCLSQILCEVDMPKATRFFTLLLFLKSLGRL